MSFERNNLIQTNAKLVSILLGFPWFLILMYALLSKARMTSDQVIPILLTVITFLILVPLGYLIWGMKNGKISDFDITKREQRYGILFVTTASVIISIILIQMIGNTFIPHMLLIILSYLTVTCLITFFWKISLHMGVNVLGIILVNSFYDWNYWYLCVAIPLIYWSRLTLKKHTPLQLILGGIVSGVVVCGGLYFFGYI